MTTAPLEPIDHGADSSGRSGRGGGRNMAITFFLALLVVAFGFIVIRGLGDAALFFYNADEAIERKDDLGESRFRLQGRVVPATVTESVDDDGTILVNFTVAHNDAQVAVSHQGDPPQLFKDGIPVVLEGQWEGSTFTSNRMLVKHEETYTEGNPERVDDYQPEA